jgi:hypothetical protein
MGPNRVNGTGRWAAFRRCTVWIHLLTLLPLWDGAGRKQPPPRRRQVKVLGSPAGCAPFEGRRCPPPYDPSSTASSSAWWYKWSNPALHHINLRLQLGSGGRTQPANVDAQVSLTAGWAPSLPDAHQSSACCPGAPTPSMATTALASSGWGDKGEALGLEGPWSQ